MGCGCNKKIQKQKKPNKVKTTLRKMWEKSQFVDRPLKVKEINKP